MATAEYLQSGRHMEYTATSDIAYMDVVTLTDRIGIAETSLKAGETGTVTMEGVYVLPAKPGITILQGAAVYWNNTDGIIDDKSESTIPAGWAFCAKASASTKVAIKIG